MTDKEMHPFTVSQCISSDWCRGYNKAVEEANEVIRSQQAEIEALINGQETLQNMCAEAYKYFAERLLESKYESSDWSHGEHPYVVEESDIENLLYELTEGSNEKET